jgi:hypothetical protein
MVIVGVILEIRPRQIWYYCNTKDSAASHYLMGLESIQSRRKATPNGPLYHSSWTTSVLWPSVIVIDSHLSHLAWCLYFLEVFYNPPWMSIHKTFTFSPWYFNPRLDSTHLFELRPRMFAKGTRDYDLMSLFCHCKLPILPSVLRS